MQRILIAYDGGEHGRRALDTGIELARAFHAELGVVSVVPYRVGRAPMDPWDDRDVHTQELAEAKDVITGAGLSATYLEPIGAVGPTIEQVARDGRYDTVVLGSRGLGTVSRVLQGSVSEHVATHADATVVIAR